MDIDYGTGFERGGETLLDKIDGQGSRRATEPAVPLDSEDSSGVVEAAAASPMPNAPSSGGPKFTRAVERAIELTREW